MIDASEGKEYFIVSRRHLRKSEKQIVEELSKRNKKDDVSYIVVTSENPIVYAGTMNLIRQEATRQKTLSTKKSNGYNQQIERERW